MEAVETWAGVDGAFGVRTLDSEISDQMVNDRC
jgi:hypothetical protein